MPTLTEAAGAHLERILKDRECPEDMAVRLVCEESGQSLVLDNKKVGDETLEHNGRTVLLLDQTANNVLDGKTIDVNPTDSGGQFFFAGQEESSG